MTIRPKPPSDFDENPPLDANFFSNARPALEDPELARILAEGSVRYREALRAILQAHDTGQPLDKALDDARALFAAE